MLEIDRNDPKIVIAIIVGGICLSFAAAVLPHYTSGFRLEPLILVSGLLPYVVYGILAYFLPGEKRAMAGGVVLGLHFMLVLQQRWLTSGFEESTLLYWFPLLLAAGLLGLSPEARRGASYPRAEQARTESGD